MRSYTLTPDEREALAEIVGYMTGAISDEYNQSFVDSLREYQRVIPNYELRELDLVYDLLSDEYTYPKITRRIIGDDRQILQDFLQWIDDNDLIDYSEWDFQSASEKVREL